MKRWKRKLLFLVGAALLATLFFGFGGHRFLSWESLRHQQEQLRDLFSQRPVATSVSFFFLYVVIAALSLPGATILTLAAGAIFGLGMGTLLVSFASSVGASAAFLLSRFIFRDWVRGHFGDRLHSIDEGLRRDGAFYLFTIRLLPIFPFFIVNILMGLTKLPLRIFYLVSQVGMLPATVVYVNAGLQLATLRSPADILSPRLIGSFILIGLLPWIAKKTLDWRQRRRLLRPFFRPRRFDYDMVVIGGGSAGLVTSYLSAAVRAKVALIERHRMGGDCLNTGCVPSKALIRSARAASDSRNMASLGLVGAPSQVDFRAVMARIQRVIQRIEPHDSVKRYRELGVDCILGQAKLKSPYEVEVDGRILTTRSITLATGARPRVPKIPGLSSVPHYTSDTIWSLPERPSRLLVLGGGPIGCELAQAFGRLGSRVTLVERGSRILSREDQDVAKVVHLRMEREGVSLRTGYEVISFGRESDGSCFAHAMFNGLRTRIDFDAVLIALGRQANVDGLGLEKLGIRLTEDGRIEADEYLRATYPNILTCGDATGPYQFTHTASHQAWYAAVNGLFQPFRRFKVDNRVVPWCTFTDPEVARVGLSEEEAKASGLDFVVTKYGLEELDRAICEGEGEGFVKVLTPPGSDRILGACIVGAHAGDIIAEFVLAMKYRLGLNKILSTIHIYPTWSEANKYVAGEWKRATAPQWALRFLERFHRWRRGQ